MKTYAYGFPRFGRNREFKKIVEGFWNGKLPEQALQDGLDGLQAEMLATYRRYVDMYPVGEMTFYDPLLDAAVMVGRYRPEGAEDYYRLCRGKGNLELTKWFNTNYHYLAPDFSECREADLQVFWNKPAQSFDQHGHGVPAMIGPFTLLKLSRGVTPERFRPLLMALAGVIAEMIRDLETVHIEEPALAMDLSPDEVEAMQEAYRRIGNVGCGIYLVTYYDTVDCLPQLYDLPLKGIGLDLVHGGGNLELLRRHGFPADKTLVAGLVDGRDVWRTDVAAVVATLRELATLAPSLMVSNAGPLYHLPVTTAGETFNGDLKRRLAFAEERLQELEQIAAVWSGTPLPAGSELPAPERNGEVVRRVAQLSEADYHRPVAYAERRPLQQQRLGLPRFPVTTIGSFPQTSDVRKARAAFRKATMSADEYERFIRGKIDDLVRIQEEAGVDVLVHGEFERSDMVEFFAEQLDGIATTRNGWVLSYGTRGYRPPIIHGDISRTGPLSVAEVSYAQSRTSRPVKGMLTGPVTIIAWSFVRRDIPLAEVAAQLALCLQDEIRDYEAAGIRIVQVDEPAFREMAPIKRRDWEVYFDWATRAFRLATCCRAETQIHTHMCYSDFDEIMEQILRLDFDVISIEASRSRAGDDGDSLDTFRRVGFDRQIGLGVWDVHSPAVPTVADMLAVMERARAVLPDDNLWINPDCGLKTRGWEETLPALRNLVEVGRRLRAQ